MRTASVVAVLSLMLTAPHPARAQVEPREFVNLVNLEVAANAFGRRVLIELGLSLDASRTAEEWQQALLVCDNVPEHWNSYGEVLLHDNRHRESIAAFERAIQLGVDRPAGAALNIARAYAHLGNRKQALRWMERSLELGLVGSDAIRREPEFERFRDDQSFKDLLEPRETSKGKQPMKYAGIG